MKYKYEIEVDAVQVFDVIQRVGQEAAAKRFLQMVLEMSTGSIGFRDSLALAVYGIEIKESVINESIDEFLEQEAKDDSATNKP